MAIKLSVLLFNRIGPFHWSNQHVAAIATDMEIGKTFEINIDYGTISWWNFYKVDEFPESKDERFRNCYIYRNATKYCNYIIDLMSDYERYEELALSSFNEYKTRLNWDVAVSEVKKLILEI